MGIFDGLIDSVVDTFEGDIKAVTMLGKTAVAGVHDALGNAVEAAQLRKEVEDDGGIHVIGDMVKNRINVVKEAVNASSGLVNEVTKPLAGVEVPKI
ncbi:hypothetical protein CALCODRAFT_494794 [Calocera cornea HHB12733]|uniref:Uncharacterized protein n=1 Tax=Calocera cornea HHB12733 TaxID=1353952 RepID=A0A165GV21_9BASI|nr:hypothetical protein CALCODRAFT_494794 [Calocera cornea HHB12733]